MITLLHGDHIEASRSELNRRKDAAGSREIRQLDGAKVDPAMLIQSLESSSLFGGETLVVIEGLFSKLGRQQKRIEALCKLITAAPKELDIVLWEDKEIGNLVIKNLGDAVTIRAFKLPVLIFRFLDTIQPGATRVTITVFEELVATIPAELIFSMLVKRIRQLVQVAGGNIPTGMSPWQLARLTSQAKSFTMEQLLALYEKLGDAEYSIRSGVSVFNLRQHLSQILISL